MRMERKALVMVTSVAGNQFGTPAKWVVVWLKWSVPVLRLMLGIYFFEAARFRYGLNPWP